VTRRRKRQIAIIAVLAALVMLLVALLVNYRATKRFGFDFRPQAVEVFPPPQYLFSFSGTDADRMQRPLGVLAESDRVYVTDSRRARIYRFAPDGRLVGDVGIDRVVVPLYLARNPKTGELYVTDRRTRSIHIFDKDDRYLRDFDPRLPKAQLPPGDTGGAVWAPVALAFASDGTLFVTEILNGHRLLIFGPDGRFKKSVGTAGLVNDAKSSPGVFQFPNGVKVHTGEVWVSDSNNRRLQVFDLTGAFKRIVPTEGLPRGFDFLPVEGAKKTLRLALVDTLAHDVTIWDSKGQKLTSFGGQGVLEGQFSYPNDLAVGPQSRIFVTDMANGRVQVWGWPEKTNPIPLPTGAQWGWCLSPLLFLPLLLLRRRKKFFATPDFFEGLIALGLVGELTAPRRVWLVTPEALSDLGDRKAGEGHLVDLVEAVEHSESDVRGLMDRLELDHSTATVLALAQRASVFCTDNAGLRRLAKVLEIDVVSSDEFAARFARGRGGEKE